MFLRSTETGLSMKQKITSPSIRTRSRTTGSNSCASISISSMSVLNRVLKKFKQDEEEWDKSNLELGEDVGKNTSDKNAIQFINLTGIDIDCWLDVEENDRSNTLIKDININS